MARIGWLIAFWIPYFGIPAYFGLFFVDEIQFPYHWDDVLRHALSSLGYGMFGCVFFAITGANRDPRVIIERFAGATVVNLIAFIWLFATGLNQSP